MVATLNCSPLFDQQPGFKAEVFKVIASQVGNRLFEQIKRTKDVGDKISKFNYLNLHFGFKDLEPNGLKRFGLEMT